MYTEQNNNRLSFLIIPMVCLAAGISGCSSSTDRQNHFNGLAASPEWQPDKIIQTLNIRDGWYIGDLGAGGGYYTYRFANETGETGRVIAADINQEFLAGIIQTARAKGLNNVDTILAGPDDSNFANHSLDLIFIRNTFHHIENKNQYMKKLVSKLKSGGRIALIDYKDSKVLGMFGHSVSQEEILSSITDTGLVIEQEFDFLEKQYFYIFRK